MKNLYSQIALTFRLSLYSMCQLLNKDIKETTGFMLNENNNYHDALSYLFFYETNCDTPEIEKAKLRKAKLFLFQLNLAKLRKDDDLKKEILGEIADEDFWDVRKKPIESWNVDDYKIITNYRLKYALSCNKFAGSLGISRQAFYSKEEKYQDADLEKRIRLLNEYHRRKNNPFKRNYSKKK